MEQLLYIGVWFIILVLSIVIATRYTNENKIIQGILIYTTALITVLYYQYNFFDSALAKWAIMKTIYILLIGIPIALFIINFKKEKTEDKFGIKEPKYSKEFLEKNPSYK
jgi:hypothetical protein